MTADQITISAILFGVLALFIWGRWRYDIVAFLALLSATALGLVSVEEAFYGFGHPATVTVAVVLIVSRGLINSGAVAILTRYFLPPVESPVQHVGLAATLAGALSGFMNNVGALAMLMPAALESAKKAARSPSVILMPLSFGSILGGLVTLIGTPPNIIVSAFRAESTGEPFGMFDFSPVGGVIAVAGIAFVALVGWRLIPAARHAPPSPEDISRVEDYVVETRVPKQSRVVGQMLSQVEDWAAEHDATIVALFRRNRRLHRPRGELEVRPSDVLIIDAGSQGVDDVLSALELRPVGESRRKKSGLFGDRLAIAEAVVPTQARIVGQTDLGPRLRRRFGVSLLAVSRQGRPFTGRLRSFRIRAGDVLLLQGETERLPEAIAGIGCMPLARGAVPMGRQRFALISVGVFAAAIGAAVAGLTSIPIALAAAAAAMVLLGIVSPREIYDSVDWPVIVLLGAMIFP